MASDQEKVQEALANAGLGDHRPLTTADVPAIAEFVKQANKPARSRSSSSSNSKAKKGGSK